MRKRMRSMRKPACQLIAACLLALWAGAAVPTAANAAGGNAAGGAEGASPPRALASNGAIVPMPEIVGLGCGDMAETLGLIDQSRYRGPGPVPPGHPDREIFEYEHRLAAAYYHACILSGSRLEDPGPAFSRGFEQR